MLTKAHDPIFSTGKAGKLAAALFAMLFTCSLWGWGVLAYATEPKVIGGLQMDRALPQTTDWSPVWVPMLISALFAYLTWPKQIPRTALGTAARGTFAMIRIELFAVFVSLLCPGLGGIYLLAPMLTKLEIPYVLGRLITSSAGAVPILLMFNGYVWLASAMVVGSALLLATRLASSAAAA